MSYYSDDRHGCVEGNVTDPDVYAAEDRFERSGSALRRATHSNPRNLPCPTCGTPDSLTPADVRRGYQCDRCADAAEGVGPCY